MCYLLCVLGLVSAQSVINGVYPSSFFLIAHTFFFIKIKLRSYNHLLIHCRGWGEGGSRVFTCLIYYMNQI